MKTSKRAAIRDYFRLTKPGIIAGNVLAAIGGFFLAAQRHPRLPVLAAFVIGTALVIGSACVFNNYLDRRIDRRMSRTKSRATATGNIETPIVLVFGTLLGLGGIGILMLGTNSLTVLLGLLGFIGYVALYTPAKHRTPYATLIGTLPGAVPPAGGYAAASGRLDLGALLLFIMLVCWQMPHFYAIAIRRKAQYVKAGVPVWPIVYGFASTRRQMLLYALGFLAACIALTMTGYSGFFFLAVMGLFAAYWAYVCSRGWGVDPEEQWAKKVFLLSLAILPLLCMLLVINPWLF